MKSFMNILLVAFIILPNARAQYSKEIKTAFQDGEYFLAYEAYEDALAGYQKVYKEFPDNAYINYRVGICLLNIPGKKAEAIPYLEKAVLSASDHYVEGSMSEKHAPYDSYFYLGKAYHLQYNLEKARENYEKYLALLDPDDKVNQAFVRQEIKSLDNARQLMEHPVYYETESLGENINTGNKDFDVVISGDESVMVYITSLKFYDALFFVTKSGKNWGQPINITPQVQSDGDLYPTGLSFDGKTLLMSRNDKFNSDIWISDYVGNEWSKARKLGKNINTKYWESSASFSPDGKKLYFTSNRKESIGGLDIFVSEWDELDNKWGPAKNLGGEINTALNEETPYFTADGKRLFFSSQGFNTMGGFDIFYSERRSDNSWSPPVNLGYPLNTTDDDLVFVPVDNGNFGYYSVYDQEKGKGNEDIYRYEIFSASHPRPVEIAGKITLNNQPEGYIANPVISIVNSNTGETIYSEQINPQEGTFALTLKKTGKFELRVTSDQYLPYRESLNIPDDFSIGSLQVQATLNPEPPKVSTVWLPVIFFDFDQSKIKMSEDPKVKQLTRILKEYPGLKIELLGYTDAKGPAEYNRRLALRRARSVQSALKKSGIDASRISVTGIGESDFVARNAWDDGSDCPEGRALNRRVGINIITAPGDFIKPESVEVPDKLKIL